MCSSHGFTNCFYDIFSVLSSWSFIIFLLLQYIRINKEKSFVEIFRKFVDLGFVELSDEPLKIANWNINMVEQIYPNKLDMKL